MSTTVRQRLFSVILAACFCVAGNFLLGFGSMSACHADMDLGTDPNPINGNRETNYYSTPGYWCAADTFNTGPYETCSTAGSTGHCSKYTYYAMACTTYLALPTDTCQDVKNASVPVDKYWVACAQQMDGGWRCPGAPVTVNYGAPTLISGTSHTCHY